MNTTKTLLALCGVTLLGSTTIWGQNAKPRIIPEPVSLKDYGQNYRLPSTLRLSLRGITQGSDRADLKELLQKALSPNIKIQETSRKANISLILDPQMAESPEGYRLEVRHGVVLQARTIAGLKMGLQTLGQLYDGKQGLSSVLIEDRPSYDYRGVMLDVSRHFFPVSFIKSLLDEMARLKLNRFHWHLVDGGGWRIESKVFPKLTKLSAFRTESNWDKWWGAKDRRFVPEGTAGAYGGYYTQAEIKDVVAYAERLGITIIPEIELPGHSNELFFSYPEIFCPNTNYLEASDVCVGNEETFHFFERVLDEVLELFPSRDIHIGGDEAAMTSWKSCPKCKERMQKLGTEDVHALQSYMIHRIEEYLNSKGRNLIGWDEILMGGLAPNAIVMSWRGEEGGITAAEAGHKVIMTPNSHLYLDFYQGNASEEPRAVGGFTPMEKVYSYAPPVVKNSKGKIMGIQANLWTEFVETPEHASYMLFPRIVALSEIAWTPRPQQDYQDFLGRVTPYLNGLKSRGQHPYELKGINAKAEILKDDKSPSKPVMRLHLSAERPDAELRYNLTGGSTEDVAQTKTLHTGESLTSDQPSHFVSANVYLGGKKMHATDQLYRLGVHKGMQGKVHYNCQWNEKYKASEERTLNDGIDGGLTYLDGLWQGFTKPMDVTVELPSVQPITEVSMRFLAEREQWVFMPSDVEVLVSEDGTNYVSLGVQKPKTDEKNPRPVVERFVFPTELKAKYVRVKANIGRSPGHFIFCDEIVIL